MQYLLLIYDNEQTWEKLSPADKDKMYQEYGQLTKDMMANGNHIAGGQLQPTATATTVRVRDGKHVLTDGPYAETKEQLAGYYLVDAKNLDEAIALAARIPSARAGSIEVRPLVVRQPAK